MIDFTKTLWFIKNHVVDNPVIWYFTSFFLNSCMGVLFPVRVSIIEGLKSLILLIGLSGAK